MTLAALARLLWAAQGVVTDDGLRTTPSAGALHPLILWVAVRELSGLSPGLFRYHAPANGLQPLRDGGLAAELAEVAIGDQPWLAEAAVVIVITGDAAGIARHFEAQPPRGLRGARYLAMEAGAAAQNIQLMATELNLSALLVGGFDDKAVLELLGLDDDHGALALIALGLTL